MSKPLYVAHNEIVLDPSSGVLLFGDDTHQGRRFHKVAGHCRKIAEGAGVGPKDMANVLFQFAAYIVGAEYDSVATRRLLTGALVDVLRAKSERAVSEVLNTGFRLPEGRLDTKHGRYQSEDGIWRHAEHSPLSDVFRAVGYHLRAIARASDMSPAELANDVTVVAGYYVGSALPDPHDRAQLLAELEDVFKKKIAESVSLGQRDRSAEMNVPPKAGWRGGSDLHETHPLRGHPPMAWLSPQQTDQC